MIVTIGGREIRLSRAVGHAVDDLFDVGIRNPHGAMAEFLDHQFGGVGVNGLVHRDHHAHFHQAFDHIAAAFGHPVRQFADNDGFGQLHVAHLLFGLHAQTQRLGAGLFLLALHRGKRAGPPAFAGQSLVQGQLASPALIVRLGLLGGAFAVFALTVGLARAQARLGASRTTLVGIGRVRRLWRG